MLRAVLAPRGLGARWPALGRRAFGRRTLADEIGAKRRLPGGASVAS